MKTELALISILALSGVALFLQGQSPDAILQEKASEYQQFVQWKSRFGFNFNGSDETYRFITFLNNLRYIEEFNADSTQTMKLGLNQFAALTNEEFRATLLKKRTSVAQTESNESNENIINAEYPSINWTDKGKVSPVQDQGNCGSCWAFGSTSQLESLNAIKFGTLQKFSEQQVTSCTPDSFGCNGGEETDAFSYVSQAGIELGEDYPYVQKNNPRTAACEYNQELTVFANDSYDRVPAQRPDLMQKQLQDQPLSVGVDAGNIGFQLYSSGVLTKNCPTSIDHAVSLTGFNGDAETPYWIVKNSWGSSWGQQGYIWIAITEGKGLCAINQDVSYPTGGQQLNQ